MFPNVLPGTYVVTVSTAGFRPAERRDLAVGTDRTIIADFLLQPATLTEAVVVTSEQGVLERSTASMGSALRSETLERLTLFGRNTFYLSTIASRRP